MSVSPSDCVTFCYTYSVKITRKSLNRRNFAQSCGNKASLRLQQLAVRFPADVREVASPRRSSFLRALFFRAGHRPTSRRQLSRRLILTRKLLRRSPVGYTGERHALSDGRSRLWPRRSAGPTRLSAGRGRPHVIGCYAAQRPCHHGNQVMRLTDHASCRTSHDCVIQYRKYSTKIAYLFIYLHSICYCTVSVLCKIK